MPTYSTLPHSPKKETSKLLKEGYAALAATAPIGSLTTSSRLDENGGTSSSHFFQQEQIRRLEDIAE